VKEVESGDGEEGLAKQAGADGNAAAKQLKPFAQVERGENRSQKHGGIKKTHCLGPVKDHTK
jgi:hypothetical protein